jgi:hypothetical protein
VIDSGGDVIPYSMDSRMFFEAIDNKQLPHEIADLVEDGVFSPLFKCSSLLPIYRNNFRLTTDIKIGKSLF